VLVAGVSLLGWIFSAYANAPRNQYNWLLAAVVGFIVVSCLLPAELKREIGRFLDGVTINIVSAAYAQNSQATPALLSIVYEGIHSTVFYWGHFVAFAVAGFATAGASSELPKGQRVAHLVLLALLTECLQLYVPGRTGAWEGVAVDCAGILAGYCVFVFIYPNRNIQYCPEPGKA
jgi:VanZ family protein